MFARDLRAACWRRHPERRSPQGKALMSGEVCAAMERCGLEYGLAKDFPLRNPASQPRRNGARCRVPRPAHAVRMQCRGQSGPVFLGVLWQCSQALLVGSKCAVTRIHHHSQACQPDCRYIRCLGWGRFCFPSSQDFFLNGGIGSRPALTVYAKLHQDQIPASGDEARLHP